jgi:hypothetical protein
MAKELETIVYTTDASHLLIKAFEELDKLRKRFVYKYGKLAFMYSYEANSPEDKQERNELYKLLQFAGLPENVFPLSSSKVYESAEEQEADHDDVFFGV